MLSYTLSLAAVAEILKADVSAVDSADAALVFALASILTIAAPVVVVIAAPQRSAEALPGGRHGSSRTHARSR